MASYYAGVFGSEEPHFLESCSLCRKHLGRNSDIFMYRYLINTDQKSLPFLYKMIKLKMLLLRCFLICFFLTEETRRFVATSAEKNRLSLMKPRRKAGNSLLDLSVKNLPKLLKIAKPFGQELSWWLS